MTDVFRHSTVSPTATITSGGEKLVSPKSTTAAALDAGLCAGPPRPHPEIATAIINRVTTRAALLALWVVTHRLDYRCEVRIGRRSDRRPSTS
jgi:hypothetical protein